MDQNAPGSGGVSKPGTAGLPGSKSGPVDRAPGGKMPESSGSSAAPQQDQSKVPGMPGSKAGPTERSPRSGAGSDQKGNMGR
jgi:hypothetical protein